MSSNRYAPALAALKSGNFEVALALYSEACRQKPGTLHPQLGLAIALAGLGKYMDSQEILTRVTAIDLLPTYQKNDLNDLENALVITSNFDLLMAIGNNLRALDRTDGLGALYVLQGLRETQSAAVALNHWREEIRLTTPLRDHRLCLLLGELCMECGDFVDARMYFDAAQSLCPINDPALLNNYALAYLNSGKVSAALATIKQALKIDSKRLNSLATYAQVLVDMERLTEALEVINHVLEHSPKNSEYWVIKAKVLAQLLDFDGARECNQKALFFNQSSESAFANTALLSVHEGNYVEALDSYQMLFQRSINIKWKAEAAAVSLALGDFDRGWGYYREGHQEIDPDSTGKKFSKLPRWSLLGKDNHVVVWKEQGVGDQLLHLNALGDLVSKMERVSLAVDERLFEFVRKKFPSVHCLSPSLLDCTDPVYQMSVVDLSINFRKKLADFPPLPVFAELVDRRNIEEMRAALGCLSNDSKFIGISWRSKRALLGRHKSLGLIELLSALPRNDFTYVNLQYDFDPDELAEAQKITGRRIVTLPHLDLRNDLFGLATVGLACNHNICTSNSTAHVLGSVGANLTVLLPDSLGLFWYWHKPLSRHPWYPQIKRIWYSLSKNRALKVDLPSV